MRKIKKVFIMALPGNFILRLIVICAGFVTAIVAVGLFMALGFYSAFPGMKAYDGYSSEIMFMLISIGVGFLSVLLIDSHSYGVAAIIVSIAEAMRWKSMTGNLVMGGACAVLLTINNLDGKVEGENNVLLITLSAGFVAGFVYWLVAGRHAGDWLGSISPEEEDNAKENKTDERGFPVKNYSRQGKL